LAVGVRGTPSLCLFSNTPPTSSILRKDYPFGKNILKYLNDSGKYLLKK